LGRNPAARFTARSYIKRLLENGRMALESMDEKLLEAMNRF